MTGAPRKPLLLRAYISATRFFPGLLARPARKVHTRLGCAPDRLAERFGKTTQPRPAGKLIWLHAASVGELLSVLDLAGDIAKATGAHLLFTTMTQTSAQLAARRLPDGAIHQFIPVDTPDAVTRFLDHWRPDMACFVESDIWPRMVLACQTRGVPLALINARPSSSREKAPRTMGYLMSCFARLTAQDKETRDQLLTIGVPPARVAMTGDLKAAAAPLGYDAEAFAGLQTMIGGRPTWLAASTHPGEEEKVLAAHRKAMETVPTLLLILIPRHPERSAEIRNLLTQNGFTASTRSERQTITPDTQVYLADTLGETGLFFRLCQLVFMGASFSNQGGHNPFEPAQLGAAVLHGPNVRNFQGDYAEMDINGAAQQVEDAEELANAVMHLTGSAQLTAMQTAGRQLMADKAYIRTAVMNHLRPLLP
ncbi:3-deoxy-D-manno-octulosonic acid transferase [Thalassovita sp.]|uniref:3-deoxy-D-manno-octulosonic acid transferase n=1 Tax=Thalassovita sp. TaxID=1979401 RepID=UPI0029DE5204|nr:3-deoxy-D-manno-octulosonic acid transferase [Thalassovita sp.]